MIDEHVLVFIEWTSVLFNIAFTVFLALEKRWSWLCGLVGSLLGTVFFWQQGLIGLTALQIFFAVMGVFGYINWGRSELGAIVQKSWKQHLVLVSALSLIVVITAYPLKSLLGSTFPYLETFITIFSVAATYLMAWKWLNQWLYWVVIDSVWLYVNLRLEFDAYALLSVIYLILSVYGYWKWRAEYRADKKYTAL